MISMLIYSCKQNEIELLQETARDIVAEVGNERLEIFTMHSKDDVLSWKSDNVDIAFVDITENDGLQIAKILRSQFLKMELVIISDNTISPVMYLTPEIRAASLLLKPLSNRGIKSSVKELFRLLEYGTESPEDSFTLTDGKEQRKIPYSHILYFEARNGKVYIRVQTKEYGIYNTLDTLEDQLTDKFKRCHRSFIVNLTHVSKVWYSKNMIVLKYGLEIPLSRSYKNIIKEVFRNGG